MVQKWYEEIELTLQATVLGRFVLSTSNPSRRAWPLHILDSGTSGTVRFRPKAAGGERKQSAKSGQKQSSNNVVPVNSFGVLSYALGRICHDQRWSRSVSVEERMRAPRSLYGAFLFNLCLTFSY
ncbi:hypothetical protein D3C79_713790 [compost metagenome]